MQDLCITTTRYHNVNASFRPSIATKDAETGSKMNFVDQKDVKHDVTSNSDTFSRR